MTEENENDDKETRDSDDSVNTTNSETPEEVDEALKAVEQLPEDQQEPIRRALRSVTVAEAFSGPIPPPRVIEAYERIAPGSAHRILQMAEKQQDHRHSMEEAVVRSGIQRERWGQIFGFTLALAAIAGGFHLINTGRDPQGFTVLIGSIVTLAGTFLYARSRQQKELREKKEALTESRDDSTLLPQEEE